MQQTLMLACWRHPQAKYIYAIPNGGGRSKIEAAIMMGEGVRAGIPDLHLPIAVGPFHSLYVELKCGRNTPSDKQEKWLADLSSFGHATAVVWDDWHLAWGVIERYLAGQLEPGVHRIKPPKTAASR